MWKSVSENLDRIVTVRMRPLDSLEDNAQIKMYEAARAGGDPLSYVIGQALWAKRGCRVAVVTGTYDPIYLPGGETDGPLGALVLARAVARLGYRVSVLTDEPTVPATRTLAECAGFEGEVLPLSRGDETLNTALADRFDAAVFVEKIGSNAKGIQHSANGKSCEGNDAKADGFAARMASRRALTIGCGDGGNEIGFGKIIDVVRKVVPHGAHCVCPCGGGIATTAAADLVFPAGTSNWAAYAIVGALACLARDPSILHTPDKEAELLKVAATVGCNDGATGESRPYLDGVPTAGAMAIVEMVRTTVQQAFTSWGDDRPF